MKSTEKDRIRKASHLRGEDINALIQDEILALIVEDYYAADLCATLSEKILQSQQVQNYTHEIMENGKLTQKYFGVDRLGVPFNSTYYAQSESETVARYYEGAQTGIQRIRDFCSPAITPIDKLRLELDEKFHLGATVAAFQGKKMLAGIGRITKADLSYLSAEQPHFDALPPQYAHLDAQLAANIYLVVPDCGGELEVWDVPPVHPLSKVPSNWREILPPSILIAPKKGELILFNCRRPHAVCSFAGQDRVTMQMFIGYQNQKQLQLWN
jgi:hypothetical protein